MPRYVKKSKTKDDTHSTEKSVKKSKTKDVTHSTEKLEKVYYDPSHPAGYAGAPKLVKEFPTNAKNWLSKQAAYTLHKPMLTRFPTRKYKTSGPNDLWQMDLMEMIPYASINKGNKYILTCIDVFSRFAQALAVKSKDATNMEISISKMLKNKVPRHIQTDLGKEFYNKKVQSLFDKNDIKHYSVHSQFKAAVVERFNRTLRERLNRYFTHQGNKKWLDALPKILIAYNHSSHSGLKGRRPIDVDDDFSIWKEQNQKTPKMKRRKQRHGKGSLVRISRISNNPFRKNFDQNWSEEVFRVVAIDTKDKPEMYIIKDMDDEVIEGKFYYEELQEIGELPMVYRIERVIRTRGAGKHKQYLVKWFGYNNKHNSWVTQDQFVQQNAE